MALQYPYAPFLTPPALVSSGSKTFSARETASSLSRSTRLRGRPGQSSPAVRRSTAACLRRGEVVVARLGAQPVDSSDLSRVRLRHLRAGASIVEVLAAPRRALGPPWPRRLNRYRSSSTARTDPRNRLTSPGGPACRLVPPRFLVRVAHPCRYVKDDATRRRPPYSTCPSPAGWTTSPRSTARPISPTSGSPGTSWASAVQVTVTGKDQPPQGDVDRPTSLRRRRPSGSIPATPGPATGPAGTATSSTSCRPLPGRTATSRPSSRRRSTAPAGRPAGPGQHRPVPLRASRAAIGSKRSCRPPS